MRRRASSLLLLVALAACGEREAPPPPSDARIEGPPVASFVEEWIPPATGSGNFEVCLQDAAENDFQKVVLPDRVLFTSWGPMQASLLVGGGRFPGAGDNDPQAAHLRSYAVVTTRAVTLTVDAPCALVPARVAVGSFGGTQQSVPGDLRYIFQAVALTVDPAFRVGPGDDPKTPGETAIVMGLIHGTAVADIAEPTPLEDPAL